VVAVCPGLAMMGTPMPAYRAGLSYRHSCRGPRAANNPTYGAVLEALSASLVRELDLAWVTILVGSPSPRSAGPATRQ
jgi:hypothetical protein